MSWFDPKPTDLQVRHPRQLPKKVIPSFIGESGQVLNLLTHHGSGDVVRDYSGFDNHGAIVGANWVDGIYGWALDYNGATDQLNVLADESFRVSPCTVECWFNSRDVTDRGGILHYDWWWNDFGFDIEIAVNAGWLALRWGTGVGRQVRHDAAAILDDLWYHLIVIFGAVGNTRTHLYMNGVLTQDYPGGYAPPVAPQPLTISQSGTHYLDGLSTLYRLYSGDKGIDYVARSFESTRAIFGV